MASWNLNFIQTLLIATGFLVLLLAAAFRRRRSGWLAPWPFILLSFTAGVSRLSDVPVLLYWLLVGVGFVFVILLHEALIERFFDPETGVKNMRALGLRKRYGFSQTIVRTAFLEDFEGYLQKYGPGVGSQYLRMTASFLGSLGPRADVYRLEGPAFALVYPRSFTKFFDTKKIEEDFRRRGFRLRKTRQKISVSLVIVEEGLAKSGQIVPDELYLEQEHTDT